MISKSVERAQKKVEENNFAIRKRLLEYDNTMNSQREVIYSRRKKALQGDRLKSELLGLMEEMIDEIVEKNFEEVNVIAIREQLLQSLLVDIKLEPEEFESLGETGVKKRIIDAAHEFYKRKEEMLGSELMARLERYAVLSVLDHKWKEHLREMDDLKEGIGLRAYGQKDPLIEYKGEAFKLFVELLNQIRNGDIDYEELEELNSILVKNNSQNEPEDLMITICATNATANAINIKRLHQIESEAVFYTAKVTGSVLATPVSYTHLTLPTNREV